MPDKDMLFKEAVIMAMGEEMRRDENVFLIGEDVGASGGVFKSSEGLFDEFGSERVVDTPISEAGYVGLCVGAAMTGLRPILNPIKETVRKILTVLTSMEHPVLFLYPDQ